MALDIVSIGVNGVKVIAEWHRPRTDSYRALQGSLLSGHYKVPRDLNCHIQCHL